MDEHDESSSSEVITETSTGDTALGSAATSSSSTQLSQTELLWNQFLKNLTKRPQTAANVRKYPNPDVPEFYPRSMKIVCKMSHETGDSSANEATRSSARCTTVDTLRHPNLDLANKNEMFVARISEQRLEAQPTFVQASETLRDVTHYYWSYYDPNLLTLDRPLSGAQTRVIEISETGVTCDEPHPPTESGTSTDSIQELRLQLQTKNQQLVHMNNVVKALLEEIYKINELLMRNRIREQECVDIHSSTEQYLKMVSELGYPCFDCCARLKEFVSHLSRQLERKVVKQHGQYRSSFVDCILSVIENSLHTLTNYSQMDDGAPAETKSGKRDACTQTTNPYPYCSDGHYASSRVGSRRSKHQVTRVYRNRNYYKYDAENVACAKSNWTRATSRNNGTWRANAALSHSQRRRASTNARTVPSSSDVERSKNPVQLVHQRFKNLNCRLEGIPEEKLVKFSYIVNDREYSAIATTKKEAQYLCAWHMLNSCSE